MRNFIFIICIVLFISCVSLKKEVILQSTIKLEGRNTNIRDYIDIDGYYSSPSKRGGNIIFFDDGTWVFLDSERVLMTQIYELT